MTVFWITVIWIVVACLFAPVVGRMIAFGAGELNRARVPAERDEAPAVQVLPRHIDRDRRRAQRR